MIREIVIIDEELCDGCGLCVPACHEGALQIVNGKARLVSDRYCDGLGACLGHCPRGAIKIECRQAEAFDEDAVAAQVPPSGDGCPEERPAASAEVTPLACGCPGSHLMTFAERVPAADDADTDAESTCSGQPSELRHWPVQLRLVPPNAPFLRGARLVVAADCVPVAYPEFHARLLRGRVVVIGCPKFDHLESYVEKLTGMIRANGLREIVVARMDVPCCAGIVYAVQEARRRAGVDIQITEVVVGTRGDVLVERKLPVEAAARSA